MRNPKRTAASASALMIGVGLVGFITIFVSSTQGVDRRGHRPGVHRRHRGGLRRRARSAASTPGWPSALDGLPEVASAAGLRQGVAQVAGSAVLVQATDPRTAVELMKVGPIEGSPADLGATRIGRLQGRRRRRRAWRSATRCRWSSRTPARRRCDVALIYGENRQAGNYLLGTEAYDANFTNRLDSKVLVKRAAGVSPAAALAAVKQVAQAYPGVKVLDRAQFKAEQTKLLDQLLDAGLRAARAGDPHRAARHRQHARPVDLRADPRARAAASRRHDPVAAALDDPLGVGHHRAAGDRARPAHRGVLRLGAGERALATRAITVFRIPYASLAVVVVLAGAGRHGGRRPTQPPSRQARRAPGGGHRVDGVGPADGCHRRGGGHRRPRNRSGRRRRRTGRWLMPRPARSAYA